MRRGSRHMLCRPVQHGLGCRSAATSISSSQPQAALLDEVHRRQRKHPKVDTNCGNLLAWRSPSPQFV